MCPCSIGLAALLVIEELHVANADVEDQNENFQDVHCLHLPAALNDESGRALLVEPMATRGTWVPPLSMSKNRHGKFSSKPHHFRWSVVFASIWIDICQAIGRYGSSKITCHMDDCIGFQQFLYNKT